MEHGGFVAAVMQLLMVARKNEMSSLQNESFEFSTACVDLHILRGGIGMTHDIDDLLEMIRQLELRLIQLESKNRLVMQDGDSWYWDH